LLVIIGKQYRYAAGFDQLGDFKENIESQGIHNNITFQMSIDPKGKHNEHRWGEEFPKAVEWLFFN
jgi:hypothetical protein